MALFAERWAAEQRLQDGVLVATVMSNLGLERFLDGARFCGWSAPLLATVTLLNACAKAAGTLAESSLAISWMTDYATTGDGLIAALQFMAVLAEVGQTGFDADALFCPVAAAFAPCAYTPGSGTCWQRPRSLPRSTRARKRARPGAGAC